MNEIEIPNNNTIALAVRAKLGLTDNSFFFIFIFYLHKIIIKREYLVCL